LLSYHYREPVYKGVIVVRIILFLSLFIFVGCGYRPVAHYTYQTATKKTYLKVVVDRREPHNALLLRDELRRVMHDRLGISVSYDSTLKERLTVSYDQISYKVLGYDADGYVDRYKVYTTLHFRYHRDDKLIVRDITAFHEADITRSGVASSRIKQDAIWKASQKALDQFIAYIASRRVRGDR